MICCAIAGYLMAQLAAALSLALASLFPKFRSLSRVEPVYASAAWRPGSPDTTPRRTGRARFRRIGLAASAFMALLGLAGLALHGLHGHQLHLVNGIPVLICGADQGIGGQHTARR